MTPKEKALELYHKYRSVETNYSLDGGYTFENTHYTDAINYSLIAVNEVLDYIHRINSTLIVELDDSNWKEVALEISKL